MLQKVCCHIFSINYSAIKEILLKFCISGTYKRTEDETMINIGLDINGTKHLDGYIGYQRKPSNHGFTYLPKLDVRVNDEKIVELSGKFKINI